MPADARRSITTTLLLSAFACALVCGFIAGEAAHHAESKAAYDQVQAASERVLDVFVATSLDAMISEDRPVLLTSARQLLARADGIVQIIVADETGAVLAQADGASSSSTQERSTTRRRVTYRGQTFGTITLAWDTASRRATVDALTWRARLVTGFAVLLASGLLTLIVLLLLVRPLRQVHRRAQQVALGAPVMSAKRQATRELHTLNASVEQLAETIDKLRAHELELEQAKTELKAARDRAEEASRHKSSFLATLSHELKTPLNSILGFSQLLHASELSADDKKMSKAVVDSGHHLLALVDEMLDFAAIDAGRLRIRPGPLCWVADVIEPAVQWVQPMAQTSGITLTLNVTTELGAGHSDPTRARQILTNIIHNAVKFTDVGSVDVTAHVTADDRIAVLVTDTGIGLTDEAIDRIFEPFVQADRSSTRRHGGTGLGLAICDRVCKALGGTIGVTSRPHHGTTFRVELPRHFAMPPAPQASAPSSSPTPDNHR